jgi:hypothetical protein
MKKKKMLVPRLQRTSILPLQRGIFSNLVHPMTSFPGTAKLQRTSTVPIQRGFITKVIKPFASLPGLPKK